MPQPPVDPATVPDQHVMAVALYLHRKWHKSKKTYVCSSDVELAEEMVKLIEDMQLVEALPEAKP